MTITDGHTDIRNYGAAELRSSKVVAREKVSFRQAVGRLMEQLRSSLGAGYSMARSRVEQTEQTPSPLPLYGECQGRRVRRWFGDGSEMQWQGVSQSEVSGLPVRSKRTPSPKQADSQSGVSGLRLLRYVLMVLMMMVGVGEMWGQITPTTDTNNPVYYLLQNLGTTSFYAMPYTNNDETTISTTNVPNSDMRFYFMSVENDEGYYFIIHSSGKYLYANGNANDDGGARLKESATQPTDNRYKFRIEQNGGGYYIINKELGSTAPLCKRGGNTNIGYKDNKNPNYYFLKLNTWKDNSGNRDDYFRWNFILISDLSPLTWTAPFTLSTDEVKHYYKIKNIKNNTYYISINTSTNKVNTSSGTSDYMVWYFKEVPIGENGSDNYIQYYYIVNAVTGNYMCFDGTQNGDSQDDVASVQPKTNENEQNCQFIVTRSSHNNVTYYNIIPKALKSYIWNNQCINQKDTESGTNVDTSTDRKDDTTACWTFESIDPCGDPTIAFDETTKKVTLSSTTPGASIYYTTTGENPTRASTLYDSGITLTENAVTTIKAVAVKDGLARSEVVTKTIIYMPTITLEGGSYTYDGTAKTPSISSVVVGETPISSDDYDVRYENNTNAGTATVIIREKTSNETIIYGTTTFAIAKAPLTVTVNDNTITYGDDPASSVEYSGFVNEETSSDLGGSLMITGYAQYGNIGTYYTVTPSGLTSDNYEISYVGGTLTVEPKEVGLSWGTTDLPYNGSEQCPTATATGLVNGDEIGVTVIGGETNMGTGYIATATELTGAQAGNYKLPDEKTTGFSIIKAPLTITANNHTITYGDPRSNNGVTYGGFVPGDDESVLSGTLSYTYTYSKGNPVSDEYTEYTITPKGLTSDNYEITFVAGTLTVEPKEVGLEWGETELTYTGVEQAPTATATGLVGDDEIGVTVEVTGAHTDVGDYTATATVLTGTKVGNYKLPAANTTTFSIVKAPLTVTAKDHTITYGDAPDNDGVTYTGFVNGETSSVLGGTLSYAYDYDQYDDVVRKNLEDEVEPYTITPSGLTATNYEITFKPGTLTVNQKEVRLTWGESSFACDGEAHAPTVTMKEPATDIVNGDVVTVTVTIEANTGSSLTNGEAVNAGYYRAIATLEGTKAGNYKPDRAIQPFTISFKIIGDGIEPAEGIEITTTDGSSVTVKDGETTLEKDTHYSVEIETQGVDHYITVTGEGNYSGAARILYVTPAFSQPAGDTEYAAVYRATSDLAKPADIDPYIVKKVNPSVGILTISPVGYLPEGVPVVLVAASNITGFQATAKPDNVAEITAQTKNSNLLKVSPEEGVEVEARQIYLFNAGEFVLTLSGTLPKGYFYLDNPNYHATGTTPGGSSRLQLIIEDDTETGIENSQLSTLNSQLSTDTWYTLDGQQLNGKPTQKGLYIVNGKKVIIR